MAAQQPDHDLAIGSAAVLETCRAGRYVSHLRYESTMAQTEMLHVRMDKDLKAQAAAALSAMGLSTADAVRLLFYRLVSDQAFPLELKVPNAETRAAMAEADAILAKRKARYD